VDTVKPFGRCCAALILAIAGLARAHLEARGYYEVSTHHYQVLTTHSLQLAEEVAGRLEVLFSGYSRLFRPGKSEHLRYTVRILRDKKEFEAYCEAHGIRGARNAGAIFVPDEKEIISYYRGKKSRMFASLYHECFHQFLHSQLEEIPIWFDEGLATYYQTAWVDPVGGGVRFGKKEECLAEIAQHAHLRGTYVPLRALIRMDRRTFYGPKRALHYAEAWSFCYFLLTAENGRYSGLLRRYFSILQKEGDLEKANRLVFSDKLLDELTPGWIDYTRRL